MKVFAIVAMVALAVIISLGLTSWAGCGGPTVAASEPSKPSVQTMQPAPPPPDRTVDLYGDPLPKNAIARLGTQRFRHKRQTAGLAFSPDGKLLVSAGADRMLLVSEPATGKVRHRLLGHRNSISTMALSHDGRVAATGSRMNGQVVLWNVVEGRKMRELPREMTIHCLAFSADDKYLAVVTDREIRIWDVNSGATHDRIKIRDVLWVAFGPDNSTMAVAERSGNEHSCVRLLNATTHDEIRRFELKQMVSAALSGDGRTLAAGGSDGSVRVWNVDTAAVIAEFPAVGFGSGWNADMAFSSDGELLASVGNTDPSRLVRVFNVRAGARVAETEGHRGGALSVALSPDGKVVATGGQRGRILTWDAKTGKEIVKVVSHFGDVRSVAFLSDTEQIVTKSQDGTMRRWDARTGTQKDRTESYWRWAISSDGKLLASVGMYDIVRIVDLTTGKQLYSLRGHEEFPEYLVFSEDKGTLASLDRDGVLWLWDLKTGKPLLKLDSPVEGTIAFSPDGSTLASGGNNGEGGQTPQARTEPTEEPIRLWDVATGKELTRLGDGKDPVCVLAFSPDGKHLASAHGVIFGSRPMTAASQAPSNSIRIWQLSDGKEDVRLKGHTAAVCSVVFSPDGSTVASASLDGTVRLWHASTGKQIAVLTGHGVAAGDKVLQGEVYSVDFSDDGKLLVSGSRDGTALVWDVGAIVKMASQP